MEGKSVPHVALTIPECSNIPAEINASSTIIEEGPRLCPLCSSLVRLFYINMDEKISMCENVDCEFPFGYEDMQLYDSNNQMLGKTLSSICSKKSKRSDSIASTTEWSEVPRANKNCPSEDTQSVYSLHSTKLNKSERLKRRHVREDEEKLEQNVKRIKELNQLLYNEENEKYDNIRSAEWINNLMKMQKSSGLQLLKEQEIKKVKRQETDIIVEGELKIDINAQSDSVTSIKIDILK